MKFDPIVAQMELQTWMWRIGKLRKMNPGINMPETADEWLLRHGKPMNERLLLPERLVHPKSKQCYLNAYSLFRRRKNLHYCEGNVYMDDCPIPVMHGWCVNDQGLVLDPSVGNDCGIVYFGVQYQDAFVRECWVDLKYHQAIGILPNVFLFGKKDDGWMDKGVCNQLQIVGKGIDIRWEADIVESGD